MKKVLKEINGLESQYAINKRLYFFSIPTTLAIFFIILVSFS